jgi:O-antigen ligase/Flp pilus assembly protein TadD
MSPSTQRLNDAPPATGVPLGRTETWLLAGLVALPIVVFDPFGWAAFGPVKWAAVSALVPALGAVMAARRGIGMPRPWAIGWALLLFWAALSAWRGLDPLSAWIGTPDRRLGWWALCLFAITFSIGATLPTRWAIPLVLRSASVATLGVGVMAVAEFAGLSVAPSGSGRLGSTLGSAAYLGAALTILVPLTVGTALSATEDRRWRLMATTASVLGVVALVGSQTRAALVGLAVAGLVALPRLVPRLSARPLAVGAVALAAVGLLALSPLGERALEGSSRTDEWAQAIGVIGGHPVLGTGPEGYRIAFPGVVDAEYERAYGREVIPDRAHNGVLDVAAALGLPGAVLYLAAVAAILRRGWWQRGGSVEQTAVAAAAIGYLAQQQFLFPLAEIDPLLWLIVGILFSNPDVIRPRPPIAGALAAVAVLSLLAGVADVAADRSMAAGLDGDPVAAERATELRPDSFRTWLIASNVASRGGDVASLERALDRIDTALTLSPADPRLGQIHAQYLGNLAALTGLSGDGAIARDAWEELARSDPNNAAVLTGLGAARALTGDAAGAERAYVLAASLAPDDAGPLVTLARLQLATGEPTDAVETLRRARAVDPLADGLDELEASLRRAGVEP